MRATLFLFIIISAACSTEVAPPEDLLTEDEMASILIDMHLLEAKINELKISVDSSSKVYRHFESEIFERNQIDSSRYYTSLDYYMRNPADFEKIYTVVIDSLSLRDKKKIIR